MPINKRTRAILNTFIALSSFLILPFPCGGQL
jgi:hypothetical protein